MLKRRELTLRRSCSVAFVIAGTVSVHGCALLLSTDGLSDEVADANLEDGSAPDARVTVDGAADGAVDATSDAGAAVVFIGASSANTSGASASLDVPLPGAIVPGDYLLAVAFGDQATATMTAPSGWRLIDEAADPGDNFHGRWFGRRVTGASDGLTLNAARPIQMWATIVAYRVQGSAEPIVASEHGLSSGPSFTAPSVSFSTPPATSRLVVTMMANAIDLVWMPPTGMTLQAGNGPVAIFDSEVPNDTQTGARTATINHLSNGAFGVFVLGSTP